MSVQTIAPPRPRIKLSPGTRRALLTTHIVASVGLLGDVAVLLATAVRAATTDDPQLAASAYELMSMFSMVFGIPLSFASLITGVLLGLATKWGVLRYGWVMTKLLLIVTVILAGALVVGPSEDGGHDALLIAGATYQACALLLATGLSVFKPRRR
jgi:uncharacterized membrane protein